jgi:hypothetical protein
VRSRLQRRRRNLDECPSAAGWKRRVIRRYARRFETPVLVETGTFLGDTVEAMRRHFREIYSIELSAELYRRARERFAGIDQVRLLHGDSGAILPDLAHEIREPCLFWLDGHYSAGETARGDENSPLRRELAAVLGRRVEGDVILVDDARLMNGRDGYPTLAELRALVSAAQPDWEVAISDDIVRIHARRSR